MEVPYGNLYNVKYPNTVSQIEQSTQVIFFECVKYLLFNNIFLSPCNDVNHYDGF